MLPWLFYDNVPTWKTIGTLNWIESRFLAKIETLMLIETCYMKGHQLFLCVQTFVFAYIHAYAYLYTHTYVCAHMYARLFSCMHEFKHTLHNPMSRSVHLHQYLCTCALQQASTNCFLLQRHLNHAATDLSLVNIKALPGHFVCRIRPSKWSLWAMD